MSSEWSDTKTVAEWRTLCEAKIYMETNHLSYHKMQCQLKPYIARSLSWVMKYLKLGDPDNC